MGSVGGLLGTAGGAGGTGFSMPSGTDSGQLNEAYQGNKNAMAAQQGLLGALQSQNGLGNQTQVYNQLQGVANGQGPNPAQAMLNQSTGANVANQAALMAGQRGAGANVGLMARQAGQQGGALQQQAAGQGASMQAQQSMNALGQSGEMANTMAANQIGQTNANVQAQQNEQSILQGANTANNAIQGQLANTTLGGQQKVVGGLFNSGMAAAGAPGGAAKMAAHGGYIQMAGGGLTNAAFGPQSMFGQSLAAPQQPSIPTFSTPDTTPFYSNQGGDKKETPENPVMKGAKNIAPSGSSDLSMPMAGMSVAAGGGKVPAMVSPGERFLKPEEAKAVAQGKASPMSVGEQIPGQAKVKGDSYANDTVPKKLEVGGVVLPRSVMQSKNPERSAAEFVRAVIAKKGKK